MVLNGVVVWFRSFQKGCFICAISVVTVYEGPLTVYYARVDPGVQSRTEAICKKNVRAYFFSAIQFGLVQFRLRPYYSCLTGSPTPALLRSVTEIGPIPPQIKLAPSST